MSLRTGHGTGRGSPRIEVLPVDELPRPVAAARAEDTRPLNRRPDGKIADSETAKTMGKRGGEAKARKVRLVDSLGLATIAEESSFGPYRAAAEEFVKAHLSSLATQAGGEVGTGPSTMVASAGLQLAASRWAFDQAALAGDPGLMKLGSTLANDSRQNLLAAYEMATREAAARPKSPAEAQADLRRRILGAKS
jgi:hypothetical protein